MNSLMLPGLTLPPYTIRVASAVAGLLVLGTAIVVIRERTRDEATPDPSRRRLLLGLGGITALLIADLLIVHRRPHAVSFKEAAIEAALASGGHAIEVRLYAEDAEADFLPATGRVERLHWPLPDPAGARENKAETRFRETRGEIKRRLEEFGRERGALAPA